jgi:sortase A
VTTELPTRRAARARKRGRVTVTGVLGELLITGGVLVLLFVVWQMWVGDMILGAAANQQAQDVSQTWADDAKNSGQPLPTSDPSQKYNTLVADPPPIEEPASGEVFATLHIPRLGQEVRIAEGTATWESLDLGMVGHYNDTAMPGDIGNFPVAGHRGSHGAPFMNLPEMQVGDAVVVETPDGWYTYRYRNMVYVTPDSVDVLDPTPQNTTVEATGRYLTMTTCSPRYGFSERLIGYAVFEAFTPRVADGKQPASLYLPKES